mgnify:CR=1 FL=1
MASKFKVLRIASITDDLVCDELHQTGPASVTAGVGVEVHPKLRLGANFGAGLIRVESISFTAAVPGSGPTNDTRTALGADNARAMRPLGQRSGRYATTLRS